MLASTNAVKLEYWHKDHLGSTAATTDHTGALTARYAYDPFGKRRDTNGSYDAAGAIVVDWSPAVNNGNDRGYTGHEHLDDVGLVHMNGRVFDPRLGVFLQADPMTQDPYNLQGFNRYGYCLNNPLTCTDPSGLSSWTDFRDKFFKPALLIAFAVVAGPVVFEQVFWLAVSSGLTGSAVTAAAGFAAGAAIGAAQGVLYGGDADDIARSALRGGFTASVFAVAGDAITNSGSFFEVGGTGLPAPAAVGIHGVAGCVTNVVGGAKCGPGAASAAFSKFATVSGEVGDDIVSGTIASAVVGGTASTLGGGKFANGARTAAFAYLFNECQHTRRCSDWMYAGNDSKLTVTQEIWGERFMPTGEHELRWTTDWNRSISISISTAVPEWPKWALDVGVEIAPKFGQDYYRYEIGYTLTQVRRDGDYFVDARAIRDVWTGRFVWKPEPGFYNGMNWRTYAGELKSKPNDEN